MAAQEAPLLFGWNQNSQAIFGGTVFAILQSGATMLRLKTRQRTMLVDKVPDLANVAAAALIFGQFVGGQPFSRAVAFAGLLAWAALIGFTLVVARRDE